MKKTSFYLKSSSDNLNIYTTIFEPNNIKVLSNLLMEW